MEEGVHKHLMEPYDGITMVNDAVKRREVEFSVDPYMIHVLKRVIYKNIF